ncbi:MAG: hypothetical protein IJF92_00575 [Bacilli bacterium]|nr:hypothetical protein [Bacilli bacterium]MBQ3307691.1 hypothetical protein [Bacilli bacterium]
MSNKFNARLSFKGDGELTVTLPIVGQISIWAGRDIYLKGATQEIIEYLRQYRVLKLEHKLNGDAKGCYKVIEVADIDRIPKNAFRPVAAPKTEHISDLKAQMMKANEMTNFDNEVITEAGQETAEELQAKLDAKQKEEDAKIDPEVARKNRAEEDAKKNEEIDSEGNTEEDLEGESEEATEESNEPAELPEDLAKIEITTGKEKGKTIGQLDERSLRKLARYSNQPEEKEAAKQALEILFPAN